MQTHCCADRYSKPYPQPNAYTSRFQHGDAQSFCNVVADGHKHPNTNEHFNSQRYGDEYPIGNAKCCDYTSTLASNNHSIIAEHRMECGGDFLEQDIFLDPTRNALSVRND